MSGHNPPKLFWPSEPGAQIIAALGISSIERDTLISPQIPVMPSVTGDELVTVRKQIKLNVKVLLVTCLEVGRLVHSPSETKMFVTLDILLYLHIWMNNVNIPKVNFKTKNFLVNVKL